MNEDELSERLLDIIPNINHDTLVDLALYVSFELELNSKGVWRAIEETAYESLHLFTLKQVC